MRKIVWVIALMLVAGCSDSASVDEPSVEYPLQVGTWEISSPTRADWRGDAYMVNNAVAKAVSDTVLVTEPEGQGLTLWVEYEKSSFIAQDVMFTYEGPAGVLEDMPITGGSIVFSDSSSLRRGSSWYGSIDDFKVVDDRLFADMAFDYICSSPPQESSEVTITLHQGDRHDPTAEQVYVFNTYGMTEVIEHIYCPDND